MSQCGVVCLTLCLLCVMCVMCVPYVALAGMKMRPDRKLTPGESIRGLYDAFNARDADAAAAFLDDDCM